MLNEKNSKGETPLFWAAKEGRLELVQLLLRKGADPTIGDSALSTPLHQAAKGGHIEIADLLIAAGAHLEATTQNDSTPLHAALYWMNSEMVDLLKAKGAQVTDLFTAAAVGDVEKIKEFLARGAPVNGYNSSIPTALHGAALFGQVAAAKILLTAGARPNEWMWLAGNVETTLRLAVARGHLEMVELLLAYGADPETDSGSQAIRRMTGVGMAPGTLSPLHISAWFGRRDIAQRLMDKGAIPDITTATGLGDLETIKAYLAAGNDVNAPVEPSGLALLSWASTREVAELLAAHGADVNVKGVDKRTPLHEAASRGNVNVVAFLIEKGADVNAVTNMGRGRTSRYTALSLALDGKHDAITELLRRHGAELPGEPPADRTSNRLDPTPAIPAALPVRREAPAPLPPAPPSAKSEK